MRLRLLLCAALAIALGLPAAAATAPARTTGVMPATLAKQLQPYITDAIADERAAVSGLPNIRVFENEIAGSGGKLVHVAIVGRLYDDEDSLAANSAVTAAIKDDNAARDEGKKKHPNVHRMRALITSALHWKAVASQHLSALASPPAPKPAIGPLAACVFVTNNGASSTETIKVVDPGAAGAPGSVLFDGQGVNQRSTFTVPANATILVPVNVGTFGTSMVTVTVSPNGSAVQTESFPFTLSSDNDVTQTDCTPH
jgi:hypothetical protein